MSREAPAACRVLIAAASALVPADRRADWVREWRTEAACAREGASWRLVVRCLGAFVHAAWLAQDRWRNEMLVQDLKYALRTLVRRPAFATVTVLTLALGIGANAAMFGAVRAVLLRPLPYPEPDRLVQLYTTDSQGTRLQGSTSPPDFMDWRAQSRSFTALGALSSDTYALSGDGAAAQQVAGASVTGGFFDAMSRPPLLGRTLRADDDAPGGPPVAVLSYALWTRRFGGDPAVVGRRVVLDGEPREVVGVMPPGFDYPLRSEVWVPLRFTAQELATQRGAHYLDVVGRLAPSASLESAGSEMAAISGRLAAAYPKTNRDARAAAAPLHVSMVREVRTGLLVLMGAVGVVLAIVCVNVAGLVLAQSLGRGRELAIRRALGAGRARLVAGLLAEAGVLGAAGGLCGLLLAFWSIHGLAAWASERKVPLLDQARLDPAVLGFAVVLSVGVALLFGALPAWHAGAGQDLAGRMRTGSAQAGAGRGRVRALLIVTQTALAGVLLVGAGLLARSFAHLRSVDLGFETADVQTFTLSLPDGRYARPEQRAEFFDRLLERIRRHPGVESVGAVFGLPMSPFAYTISTSELDGRRLEDQEQDRLSLHIRVASTDYFRTMGMPVARGRAFGPHDVLGAPPVVIVSESAARLLWPGGDALGHRVAMGTSLGMGRDRRFGGEVVGVVPDVRHRGPAQPVHPTIYAPQAQVPVGFATVVVRGPGSSDLLPLLRADVAGLDAEVPIYAVRTMEQVASDALAQPRAYLVLLAVFAGAAVLLASVGLYGVLAQTVGQRTREIGIRMALGAERRQVVWLVMTQGGRLAVVGIVAGLVGAALASRAMAGLLFGVAPLDVPTYAAVGATLLVVALAASFIPARRAAGVDPVRALRAD
jgi:putative ABC transport system permease protein